ncbi:iron-containing alcohol dehydrogenase, partial [Mycobacterium tuberculosis]|nr:iron-containing alcohol dehydrogenase [Mycobacterium tuberculosis]
ILLGDQALNHYPESFAWFGQGYVWGALSFEFALFILLAAAFTFLLHKTNFGRRTHAIEAFVSVGAHPLTDANALEAIRLINLWLPKAVDDGHELQAREQMAFG